MTRERDVLKAVTDYLSLHRYRFLRIHPVRPVGRQGAVTFIPVAKDQKGAPDILVIGPRWILAVEVKAPKGKLSPEQMEWEADILRLGHTYVVIRDVLELARILKRMPNLW